MNIELKPRFWAILNGGIEQAFLPLKFANNEEEAVEYYKNNVLNRWQKERYVDFNYEAKAAVSYVC